MKTMKALTIVGAAWASVTVCAPQAMAESMRLEWVLQGQFAGPLLALEKGYYEEAGIDLTLEPGSSDLKAAVTVAQGVDTFGIGHPNQVITARSNEAPLVEVLQLGQKSASTYIARKDSGIQSVTDLPGHSVGLWFGGDEQEFMAMLRAAKIDPSSINIISQGYDIIGWLNNRYEVMQVARYNELMQVYAQGFEPSDLVFLNTEDWGTNFINTGIFTTEDEIKNHPDKVQAVVTATLRGWKEALENPEEAAEIVVKYNGELTKDSQIAQIKAMGEMFCAGPTLEGRFGESRLSEWERIQQILIDAKLIEKPIDLSKAFTNAFWEAAPAEYKTIPCAG